MALGEIVAHYMERATLVRKDMAVDVARQIVENDPNDLGIVVDEDGALVGVLAVADIVLTTNLKEKLDKPLDKAALHTPKDQVLKCTASESVDDVLARMVERNLKAAVVVDEDGRPIGVLSRNGYRKRFAAQFQVRL